MNALIGRSILVIEDEPLLAFELTEELERLQSFPIGPASSIEEALVIIGSGKRFDAALLNVFLRGENTFTVAEALIARDIPFLFVTGAEDLVRENYPEIPLHPKPLDMPEIVSALGLLVESRSQEDRTQPAGTEQITRALLGPAPDQQAAITRSTDV